VREGGVGQLVSKLAALDAHTGVMPCTHCPCAWQERMAPPRRCATRRGCGWVRAGSQAAGPRVHLLARAVAERVGVHDLDDDGLVVAAPARAHRAPERALAQVLLQLILQEERAPARARRPAESCGARRPWCWGELGANASGSRRLRHWVRCLAATVCESVRVSAGAGTQATWRARHARSAGMRAGSWLAVENSRCPRQAHMVPVLAGHP